MFSNDAVKNAEACRFCWMCRHLCPTGSATGNEAYTPRARGLLISMVNSGRAFTSEMAEIMYQCCLCNACAKDCVTGFEPGKYIREARSKAIIERIAPDSLEGLIESIQCCGNYYGFLPDQKLRFIDDLISELPKKANVLLYVGDITVARAPEIARAGISLMQKAGVAFTVLKDEPSSGEGAFELLGNLEETAKIAVNCAEKIASTAAKQLVVLNPHDATVFRQNYSGWGAELYCKILTAPDYFAKLLCNGALNVSKTHNKVVTYHDPCKLARELDDMQSTREIIGALGLELREMFLTRMLTRCCSGALLSQHSPKTAAKIATQRVDDAKNTKAELLVTACPGCYKSFATICGDGIMVKDILVLLDESCSVPSE